LGKTITPFEASEIKSAIGKRINFQGTIAVTDEVKPVYRELYGSLKTAVHTAVPEAAEADERLTNLMAAHDDLLKEARKEEVEGTPAESGRIVPWLQTQAGRIVPAL